MSTLAYSYPEPYKLPAGVLALAVHAAFFALLYFGVNWHNDQPQGMEVDIWSDLPSPQVEPVIVVPPPPPPMPLVEPVKPIEMPKLPEPVEPPKADIELAVKKKPQQKLPEPAKPVEIKPVQPKTDKVQMDSKARAAQAAQQAAQAEQARARAAQAAATDKMVEDYKGRIEAKIKRYVVEPPDVLDTMQAEFDVTLIPGGSVLSTRLTKPSGNSAYDDAVDRAITKAQPLPLPPDPSLFNRFRELHVTIRPKNKE